TRHAPRTLGRNSRRAFSLPRIARRLGRFRLPPERRNGLFLRDKLRRPAARGQPRALPRAEPRRAAGPETPNRRAQVGLRHEGPPRTFPVLSLLSRENR